MGKCVAEVALDRLQIEVIIYESMRPKFASLGQVTSSNLNYWLQGTASRPYFICSLLNISWTVEDKMLTLKMVDLKQGISHEHGKNNILFHQRCDHKDNSFVLITIHLF